MQRFFLKKEFRFNVFFRFQSTVVNARLRDIVKIVDAGGKPSDSAFIDLLKICAKERDYPSAQRAFAISQQSGLKESVVVNNTMLSLLHACNRPDEANEFFKSMGRSRNVVGFNIMIQGQTDAATALGLFEQMSKSKIVPTERTFVALIERAGSARDYDAGMKAWTLLHAQRLPESVFTNTSMLRLLASCGRLEEAVVLFRTMTAKDVVTWTVMMQALASSSKPNFAILFSLVDEMTTAGIRLDERVFVVILDAAASARDYAAGMRAWSLFKQSRLPESAYVNTTVLRMLCECQRFEEASSLFQSLSVKGAAAWTIMLQAHGSSRAPDFARMFSMVDEMTASGVRLDARVFVVIANAAASARDYASGMRAWSLFKQSRLPESVFVNNTVLNMLGECGRVDEAKAMFQSLSVKDAATWTVLLQAHARVASPNLQTLLALFDQMLAEGVQANDRAFLPLIDAATTARDYAFGMNAWARFRKLALADSVFVSAAMLRMLGACGRLEEARALFEALPAKNIHTWTAMLQAHASASAPDLMAMFEIVDEMTANDVRLDERLFVMLIDAAASARDNESGMRAWSLFKQSRLPDSIYVNNTVIHMLGECQRLEEAKVVFQSMSDKTEVTWGAMLQAHAVASFIDLAAMFDLVKQMLATGVLSPYAFSILISACATRCSFEDGSNAMEMFKQSGLPSNPVVHTAILTFFSKCGELLTAERYFRSISRPSSSAYSALIQAHASFGNRTNAVALYNEMQEVGLTATPNSVVSVLSAFSHSLDPEGGLRFYKSLPAGLQQDEHVTNVLVDCLARSSRFTEAISYAQPFMNSRIMLATLLGAFRTHKNVSQALPVAERLIALDPMNAMPYILMANIYQSLNDFESARAIQERMRANGATPVHGISTTEIAGQQYSFGPGDFAHDRGSELRNKCDEMATQLLQHGVVPDVQWSTTGRTEEEKRAALCVHSERIAIAYNLLTTPPGTTIRIHKNLRMCGDCHTATKALARIYNRKMLVRDKFRWHEFDLKGQCSCGDRY
eukprot:TRINITY_DN2586_c0_g1_i1.p1 TRINITY_DN2586_c0_g1~~TRINITY_DN2586_c0_g1_i1.p1  ORF type:complete len:1025 (-),score=175.41 TRINITY_DN2586_c0_g1_i1:205-3279(-)